MGRWDKREQELLEQQAQEESAALKTTKQDSLDIDGNGVIDADEGVDLKNDEEHRRVGHKL